MINPSAAQIVRNIETVLVDIVEPAVTTTAARSALATIGHLLRHVALRIENEGQVLDDDIASLLPLLDHLSAYLDAAGDQTQARAVAAAIRRAEPPADRYPSLAIMAERAGILRQAVQDGLQHLQQKRPERGQDADYLAVRAAIRDYLAQQLRGEAQLIHPAFEDKGPRR